MGTRIGLHACLRGISSKAAECRVTSDAIQTLMRKMRRSIEMGCVTGLITSTRRGRQTMAGSSSSAAV